MKATVGMLCLSFVLGGGESSLARGADAPAAPHAAPTPAGEVTRLFAEGKAQVEAQCADCMGATREGLTAGLKAVRAALDHGYPGSAEGWRLLAEGYGALAWGFLPPDSPAQADALGAQREAYERWLDVEPRNTKALYDFAFTFSEPERRRPILERLLEVDPGHAEGLFGLGQVDLEQGRDEVGLARMRKASKRRSATPIWRSSWERACSRPTSNARTKRTRARCAAAWRSFAPRRPGSTGASPGDDRVEEPQLGGGPAGALMSWTRSAHRPVAPGRAGRAQPCPGAARTPETGGCSRAPFQVQDQAPALSATAAHRRGPRVPKFAAPATSARPCR